MIGVITVKVSAAKPSFPISTVPVFVGSDCTLAVGDVPSVFYGVRLTSVSVSITNADGATVTAVCVRSGVTWCATIPGAHFRVPGRVRAGLTVSACGTHEDGTTIGGWTLGRGDVEIMPADAVPAPGVAWQDVHLRDDEPEVPVKGDLAKVGGFWKIYTGAAWDPIGGGGGAVESVNGKKGAIVLDARDVGARPSDWTPTADDVGALPLAGGTLTGDLVIGKENTSSRKITVAADNGAIGITLQGGVSGTGSSVTIGGSSGNGGTFRVQGGANDGGTIFVGGSPFSGGKLTVHGGGNRGGIIEVTEAGASIRKNGKEVATEEQLTPISAQSAYPMSTVVDGALKDRTVNHATVGGTFTFPERTGTNARDFVLVIDALETAPTVTFPGSFTYVSEQDAADIWTAEAGKVNSWYFSEQTDGVFMVCHKAMGVVAQ